MVSGSREPAEDEPERPACCETHAGIDDVWGIQLMQGTPIEIPYWKQWK